MQVGKLRDTDTRQLPGLLTEPRSCSGRLALEPPPLATELGSEQTCSGHPGLEVPPVTLSSPRGSWSLRISRGLGAGSASRRPPECDHQCFRLRDSGVGGVGCPSWAPRSRRPHRQHGQHVRDCPPALG